MPDFRFQTIVFFLAMLLPVCAAGQELELDTTTNKLMYRRVVEVDSATAVQLYELARQWMARAYKSADNVLQYENKEEGKLIGRGVWPVAFSTNNERMEHVIIIECREGRVRYTFTDFVRETYDAALGRQRKALEDIKFMKKSVREAWAKEAARTGGDLEKALKPEPVEKNGDRW